MNTNTYVKRIFKCSICDKEYDNTADRAHCELSCIRRQEEEAKKAAELKKQQEHATRKADADAKVKAALEAVNAYTKDYGFYTYDGEVSNMISDIPSKLFHYFF